jgi:hypothetical protein
MPEVPNPDASPAHMRQDQTVPDDDDWLDHNDTMGLWEYQLQGLTVEALRVALDSLPGDLPVEVAFYDGVASRSLRVMHIDLKGTDRRPSSLVVTVA